MNRPRTVLPLLLLTTLLTGCGQKPSQSATTTLPDPARGKAAIARYGCAVCHEIPGVPHQGSAPPTVGPSLAAFPQIPVIGKKLPNTPENAARWIEHPQEVSPTTAMPNLGVSPADARDIVSYLETLK